MAFAHDTAVALQAAAALVNSVEEPETLGTAAELDTFCAAFGYTGRRDHDVAELRAVRALRPRLRELLLAPRDDAARIVNELLAEAGAVPRLVRHDDVDWHVHAVDGDATLATRIVIETAMAMIDVVRLDEGGRFSVCADAGCRAVVVDLSRNRSRRFCSTTCGNRNAVAAYRARRAGPT